MSLEHLSRSPNSRAAGSSSRLGERYQGPYSPLLGYQGHLLLVSEKPFAGIVWVTSQGRVVSDTLGVSLACSRTFSVTFRIPRHLFFLQRGLIEKLIGKGIN